MPPLSEFHPTGKQEAHQRQVARDLDLGRRLQHPRSAGGPQVKDFILPLIFTKRLCDVFDDELNRIAQEVGSRAKAFKLVQKDRKLVRFFLPLKPPNADEPVWARPGLTCHEPFGLHSPLPVYRDFRPFATTRLSSILNW